MTALYYAAPLVAILLISAYFVIKVVAKKIKRFLRIRQAQANKALTVAPVTVQIFSALPVGQRVRFKGHHGGYRHYAKVIGTDGDTVSLLRCGSVFTRTLSEVRA